MSEANPLPEGLSEDDLTLSPSQEGQGDVEQPKAARSDAGFDHSHSEHHPPHHPHAIHHAAELQPSLEGFVEGWQLGLYRDAVLGGALAALALGLLGVFIVLRRAVFAAATVGQAAGLGVVVAFYLAIHWGLELPPIVGALAFSALATSAVGSLGTVRSLPRDAGLGLAFLLASASAIALGDRITQEAGLAAVRHFDAALSFGSRMFETLGDPASYASAPAGVKIQRRVPTQRTRKGSGSTSGSFRLVGFSSHCFQVWLRRLR